MKITSTTKCLPAKSQLETTRSRKTPPDQGPVDQVKLRNTKDDRFDEKLMTMLGAIPGVGLVTHTSFLMFAAIAKVPAWVAPSTLGGLLNVAGAATLWQTNTLAGTLAGAGCLLGAGLLSGLNTFYIREMQKPADCRSKLLH